MKRHITLIALTVFITGSVFAQLPKVGASGGGLGDLVSQFANEGLSADAMDSDFSLDQLMKTAQSTKDVADLGHHVSNLIGHIKPGMFKEGVDVTKMMDMANSAKSIADATGVLKKLENSLLPKAFKGDWAQKSGMWNKALDALK